MSEVAHSFLSVPHVRDRHKGEENLHRPTISLYKQYLSVCWSAVSLYDIMLTRRQQLATQEMAAIHGSGRQFALADVTV